MNHNQYVANRIANDPRFEDEQAAAAAELKFATMVSRERSARKMSIEALAGTTGIAAERLDAIEEGETATLNELLWLSHALDLIVTVDPNLKLRASVRPRLRVFGDTSQTATSGTRPANSPNWAFQDATSLQTLTAVDCVPSR